MQPGARLPNSQSSGECLISDRDLKSRRRQYDAIIQHVQQSKGKLNLTPELLQSLHRIAIDGIYPCAGRFRIDPVYLVDDAGQLGPYQPPPAHHISLRVTQLCDYANNPGSAPPIHTAAYLMWRINWIHPFLGGNGRTARAVAYLSLCVRLGYVLPGVLTIPEQIEQSYRTEYFAAALRDADSKWEASNQVGVEAMESLLTNLLSNQLKSIFQAAAGTAPPPL